ncbi:hypothetical protein ACQKKX_18575 [Neorhizobium sp. NPDC001467]
MSQPASVMPVGQPIPQHVAERLESEWRQVRESAPSPVTAKR